MDQGDRTVDDSSFFVANVNFGIIRGVPLLDRVIDEKQYLRLGFTDACDTKFLLSIANYLGFSVFQERFLLSDVNRMSDFGVLGKFCVSVENSSLISDIVRNSLNTISANEIRHTRFLFNTDIVDVVSFGELEMILAQE